MLPNNPVPGSGAVQLVECPRDAMQGWPHFIPTEVKIAYLNQLLIVGFDTIDFGSFVSPKAIPQMRDTQEVLANLDLQNTPAKLLAIVANARGAQEAASHKEISFLGFPFSLSPTFQVRNTNTTPEESLRLVDTLQELCLANNKTLVVYLSMGFGNPYGDAYNEDILLRYAQIMAEKGIRILSLSDTVGLATPQQVADAFKTLVPAYPDVVFGAHLHTTPVLYRQKLAAALDNGCRRFDGALKGIGGCPMAGNELVGNMPTEAMIDYLQSLGWHTGTNGKALQQCVETASKIFV